MKKPRIALAFAFAFLIILRVVTDKYSELTMIVAMINIGALFVVLFDVAEKLKESVLQKIGASIEAQAIADREKAHFSPWFYGILITFCALFTIVYLSAWCCGLGNDLISIIALAISVLDNEIVALGTFLYKV